MLEDADGNRILIDADGNPLVDANGKPLKVTADMLSSLGITLGEPEKLDIDPSMIEKLNILANMIKGFSEEEALAEFNRQCMENELA